MHKLNDSLDSSNVAGWIDWEGIPLNSDWIDKITRAIIFPGDECRSICPNLQVEGHK